MVRRLRQLEARPLPPVDEAVNKVIASIRAQRMQRLQAAGQGAPADLRLQQIPAGALRVSGPSRRSFTTDGMEQMHGGPR